MKMITIRKMTFIIKDHIKINILRMYLIEEIIYNTVDSVIVIDSLNGIDVRLVKIINVNFMCKDAYNLIKRTGGNDMGRVDIRINLSFKNNAQELELYNFVREKGSLMGDSTYLKLLIQRAMLEEQKNDKDK